MSLARARSPALLAAVLACLVAPAVAQGWVDPPAREPATPPVRTIHPPPPAAAETPPTAQAPTPPAPAPPGPAATARQEPAPAPVARPREPTAPQRVPRVHSARRPAEREGPVASPPRQPEPRVVPEPRVIEEPRVVRGPTPNPSFNCRYARSSVERAICADPVLAAKDRRMALLYEQAGGSRHGPVDITQFRWLSARNACGASRALEACVERVYDARIAELSGAGR